MRKNIFERACLEEQHRREHEREYGCPYNCETDNCHYAHRHGDIEYLSPGKKLLLLIGVALFAIFGTVWGLNTLDKAEAKFQEMKEETIKDMQDMNYRLNPNRVKPKDINEKAMEETEIEKE